jgi:hypothetical protein
MPYPPHARLETRNGLTSGLGNVSVPKTSPLPDLRLGLRACERTSEPTVRFRSSARLKFTFQFVDPLERDA